MAERRKIAIEADIAYSEQERIIEFLRDRNLMLAQENKRLMQENEAFGARAAELERESADGSAAGEG